MLADAYKLCCERNARNTDESKHTPTTEEPAVFVFVEEMSHMMEFTDTIETHDGMECDASTLIMLIARAGRAACVRVILMSQTALNSSSG
jgi:DNA segregation ATPase FtsK/SpoIIIE-like protein